MKYKRLISGLFAIMLALTFVTVSHAMGQSFLQDCSYEENAVILNMRDIPDADQENFTVTLARQTVEIENIENVSDAGEGITWWFLLDDSWSLNADQQATVRNILQRFQQEHGEKDNFVICDMSDPAAGSGLLEKDEDISSAIQNWNADNDYTYLYDSLVYCLQEMESSKEINEKHCLVILSDGDDNTITGKTLNEVQYEIGSSRIPVYTVAVLPAGYDKTQKSYAENMSGLANISVGGEGFITELDGLSSEEIADSIMEEMRNDLVMNIDLTGISLENVSDKIELRVKYETESEQYDDSLTLYTEDLQLAEEIPDTTVESETDESFAEPSTAFSLDPEPDSVDKGFPLWGWILIGLGILIVIIIVILLLLRKNKKTEETPVMVENIAPIIVPKPEKVKKPEPVPDIPEQITAPCRNLKLVAIDHEEITFQFSVIEGIDLILGSDTMQVEDSHLLPKHCILRVRGKHLYAANYGNSVISVNGVPIRAAKEMPIEDGGKIRLGTYEYRVLFEEDML